MDGFHFDVPEDQRLSAQPASDWIEWAMVAVLCLGFLVGFAGLIAFAKGWI